MSKLIRPLNIYGFKYGHTAMSNAHGFLKAKNIEQKNLNKAHRGGKSQFLTVPQFYIINPSTPNGPNHSSKAVNHIHAANLTNSIYDKHAYIKGGRRNKSRKSRKSTKSKKSTKSRKPIKNKKFRKTRKYRKTR